MHSAATTTDLIDRALHHVDPPAVSGVAPLSLPLPVPRVRMQSADGPIPGMVPASTYDLWAPIAVPSGFHSAPRPVPPPDLDGARMADQLAAVARSKACLDRARAYADRLGSHLDEIRAKLTADAERNVVSALARTELVPVNMEALRGELIDVQRRHRQALDILADVEAEHAGYEADLAVMLGSDGAARGTLKDAHQARAQAATAADDAKALLGRAKAHAEAVGAKLAEARAIERRHDDEATARLRAALLDDDFSEPAAEPFIRTSAALEDDLRTAALTIERLGAEHEVSRAALATAERGVLKAVDGVLTVEAEGMARELTAIEARAVLLRQRLTAYAARTASDYVPPDPASNPARMVPGGWMVRDPVAVAGAPKVHQTPGIATALGAAPLGQVTAVDPAAAQDWTVYAAALGSDPAAEPGFGTGPSPAHPAYDPRRTPLSSLPPLATLQRQIRDATAA